MYDEIELLICARRATHKSMCWKKMYRQLAAAVADEKEITKLKMKLSNTNDVYLWLMVLGSSIPFRCHQNYHPIEMNAKHSLLLPLTYRVMAL